MALKKQLLLCLVLLLAVAGFSQPRHRAGALPALSACAAVSTAVGRQHYILQKRSLAEKQAGTADDLQSCVRPLQHTAEELVQHKDDLKNIQIVMATLHTISQMNAFAESYGLKALPNVVLGKDVYFILPSFYNIHNLSYMRFTKPTPISSARWKATAADKALDVFKNAGK